ncbi:hypothetical protein GWI33_005302 [Rhynchophorus ferrugineus]|uniref:Uncharacterized protein n=1 Tax=Rhynchophorus ferrugineus TaxID=354439 RepID=A0A834IJH6_RHYFE|nr:hypothetical protein GWI33_005302 [Rhynchophorus ferrugineus]
MQLIKKVTYFDASGFSLCVTARWQHPLSFSVPQLVCRPDSHTPQPTGSGKQGPVGGRERHGETDQPSGPSSDGFGALEGQLKRGDVGLNDDGNRGSPKWAEL